MSPRSPCQSRLGPSPAIRRARLQAKTPDSVAIGRGRQQHFVAAVGLVENNAVNIVAAMLLSPLMGPVMALTFGTMISDRKLQKIGVRSGMVGMGISLVFGYIFGCLVGCTESPWGTGNWPTEAMIDR
uniref:(California timema) hypothetical protein n=1 Tax=Timema californicum TaxID=61474 RepID=A0A7R9PET5_TIMCA|nr:unnamed protein product [Timema californicum]